MKDLKHLIYFENLLENADNELVEKAKADGGVCLGYTCFHIPEVLLNIGPCFSSRLRAPNTGSIDIATYYMSNYTCEYARALLERAIEGGYQFLDALIGVDACSMMNRSMEHFEILKVNDNPKFFVTHCDMPFKITDYTIDGYVKQMQVHVLDRIHETFGVDVSDEAIRKAVEEHNEVCRIMTEISEMRKQLNPIITGYEFHVLNLVTYTCPKALILPYLRETLEELKKRKPDKKNPYRARVAIVGSEIDDPSLTKLIEGCGWSCPTATASAPPRAARSSSSTTRSPCCGRSAAITWRSPSAPATSPTRRCTSAARPLTAWPRSSRPRASSTSR